MTCCVVGSGERRGCVLWSWCVCSFLQGFAIRTKEVALITAVGIVAVLSGGKPISLGERWSLCLCACACTCVCKLGGNLEMDFSSRKILLVNMSIIRCLLLSWLLNMFLKQTNKQTNKHKHVFVVYHTRDVLFCMHPTPQASGWILGSPRTFSRGWPSTYHSCGSLLPIR